VLKSQSTYFVVCFSDKNGPKWNHFTREQIVDLFEPFFTIAWMHHVASLEGNNITRYKKFCDFSDVTAKPKLFGQRITVEDATAPYKCLKWEHTRIP
jgi:hypothetical protein